MIGIGFRLEGKIEQEQIKDKIKVFLESLGYNTATYEVADCIDNGSPAARTDRLVRRSIDGD